MGKPYMPDWFSKRQQLFLILGATFKHEHILNYAATAKICCFQAFPHRFLLEMHELRRVENLRLLAK